MTPDERAVLQHLGETVFIHLADMVCATIFLVISVGVFAISTSPPNLTAHPGFASHPRRRVIFALSSISCLAASLYASTVLVAIYSILRAFNDHPGALKKRSMYEEIPPKLLVVNDWAWALLPFFTDSITIWRGSILFPKQRWGFFVALSLAMAGMATRITHVGFTTHYLLSGSDPNAVVSSTEAGGFILSLVANVAATGLMAYGAWLHKRFLTANLSQKDQRHFRVCKILHLLVESGFGFCTLQAIVTAIVFLPDRGETPLNWRNVMYTVFVDAYIMIAAMYPSLVTLVIRLRGSIQETYSYHTYDTP